MWHTAVRQLRDQQRLERVLPPLPAGPAAEGPCPLSAAQRRLWYLDRATLGGRLAYNVTYATTVVGRLDQAALSCAVDLVVGRHAALRMAFRESAGEPQQCPVADQSDRLQVTDLCEAPAGDVARWLGDCAGQRFDLEDGVPFRVFLGRRGVDEHLLLASGHHIVLDGRSLNLVLWEVGERYTDLVLGRAAHPDRPGLQVSDVVRWQRAWLAGASGSAHERYWRGQLAGPAFTRFGISAPDRPSEPDYSGGRVERRLPPAVTSRVEALASVDGLSTVSIYLAAFQALVHWHRRDRYVVTGIPAANRGRAELANVVGFLANVLPIPSESTPAQPLRLAARVADELVAAAYVHQAMPIEHLVPEALPALAAAMAPMDTFFAAYRQVVTDPLAMPGLAFGEAPPLSTKDTESWVMLTVFAGPEDATAMLSYGSWRLTLGAADTLAGAYADLVDLASAAPDTPMGHLLRAGVDPC